MTMKTTMRTREAKKVRKMKTKTKMREASCSTTRFAIPLSST
jgi:hypothetical protein